MDVRAQLGGSRERFCDLYLNRLHLVHFPIAASYSQRFFSLLHVSQASTRLLLVGLSGCSDSASAIVLRVGPCARGGSEEGRQLHNSRCGSSLGSATTVSSRIMHSHLMFRCKKSCDNHVQMLAAIGAYQTKALAATLMPVNNAPRRYARHRCRMGSIPRCHRPPCARTQVSALCTCIYLASFDFSLYPPVRPSRS